MARCAALLRLRAAAAADSGAPTTLHAAISGCMTLAASDSARAACLVGPGRQAVMQLMTTLVDRRCNVPHATWLDPLLAALAAAAPGDEVDQLPPGVALLLQVGEGAVC